MLARHILLLALFSAAGRLEPAAAQIIVGRTIDEVSRVPLRAVDLRLLDAARAVRAQVLSDSAGNFELLAPIPGKFRVTASALGYESQESQEFDLTAGLEVEVELRLVARGIPLEPIRVINSRMIRLGRLAEYYERAERTRRTGLGRVYLRDDLERIGAFNVSSILRTQPTRADCPNPLLLLDGLPMSERDLDGLIRPEEVEGIEFYRGLEVPPEYQRRGVCAVTLVWSRRDPPGIRPMSWRRVFVSLAFVALIFGAQKWVRH